MISIQIQLSVSSSCLYVRSSCSSHSLWHILNLVACAHMHFILLVVAYNSGGSKQQAQAGVLQVREHIYVTCRLVKDFQQVVHLWAQRYCCHPVCLTMTHSVQCPLLNNQWLLSKSLCCTMHKRVSNHSMLVC
jgi:hypothetical protein